MEEEYKIPLEERVIVETIGGALKPFYNRQGNKFLLRSVIVPLIPPHKIYVELFAGSGAIFFNKEKAEKNILNDLDKQTIGNLRLLKIAPTNPALYNQDISTIDKAKRFYTSHINKKNSPEDQLVLNKIISSTGYSSKPVKKVEGIYKTFNPQNLIKKLDEYKGLLKGVELLNQDYESVVKKYDGFDTFFFIDPPYENTNQSFGYAEGKNFNFERLAQVLAGIKGKFLMTINDSKRIRQLFKGFNIKPIKVYDAWKNKVLGEDKNIITRGELLITNYKPII